MAESPSELRAEIEKLERKHAGNPEGRYFVPLANDYRKLGDLARAEELLREGLRKHPEYLSAHIVLGRCLADREKRMDAAEEFTFVLSMDPQNLIALRSLGELALADGRPEEAARWYRELLAVDPMNDEARQALSEIESPARPASLPDADDAPAWWGPATGAGAVEEPEQAAAGDPNVAALHQETWSSADAIDGADDESRFGRFVDLDSGDLVLEDDRSELAEDRPAHARDTQIYEPAVSADEIESVEVVTETIAELYARQGLHDRAIGVYRELIRRRGGDAALERRLAELERAAASGEEVPARSDPAQPAAAEFGAPDLSGQDWDAPGERAADDLEEFDIAPTESSGGQGQEADGDFADSNLPAGGPSEDPVRRTWMQDMESVEPEEGARSPAPRHGPELVSAGFDDFQGGGPGSELHDPFADSFESGFAGPSTQAGRIDGSGEPPSDREAPEEEQEHGAARDAGLDTARAVSTGQGHQPAAGRQGGEHQTIAEYLAALAAWTPGRGAVAPKPADTSPRADAAVPAPASVPVREPESSATPSVEPAAEGGWDSEPFPWEISAGEDEPAASPAAELEAASDAPKDDYSSPTAPVHEGREGEREPQIGLADYFPEDDAAPAVSEPEPGSAASQEADSDDDDLESFQAWLRSLKR